MENAIRVIRLNAGEKLTSPSAVCLGFFDGVHLGHQALLKATVETARARGLTPCVHTFRRMPAQAMHPEKQILELTSLEEKLRLFAQAGIEAVGLSEFDDETRRMSARAFIEKTLIGDLSARYIVAGYNHRFGYRGECGAEMLSALCAEYSLGLSIVEPVKLEDGEAISSTAIRRAVAAGDFALAERMLGRPVPETLRRRSGE